MVIVFRRVIYYLRYTNTLTKGNKMLYVKIKGRSEKSNKEKMSLAYEAEL